jgi:putative mRNA 3-end processing factor
MITTELLELTESGLFCAAGNFFIDPWKPVKKAIITHGHADHACRGCEKYLNGLTVSLHPAGHILGSAQIRIEDKGKIWVVSGDYKVEPDPTCTPFEPLACHTLVTESTFALPIFRWQPQQDILDDINNWWETNRQRGRTSVLFAYALGKAQRVVAGLDASIGPIFTHGAVEHFNQCYRETGITLPSTQYVGEVEDKRRFQNAMIIAPPSVDSVWWTKRFTNMSSAFASGWMQIRGNRRRRSVDRGFALSDHSDWGGLIDTITAAGAETIWVTHGYSAELVRWLREQGLDAKAITTRFSGEINDTED